MNYMFNGNVVFCFDICYICVYLDSDFRGRILFSLLFLG